MHSAPAAARARVRGRPEQLPVPPALDASAIMRDVGRGTSKSQLIGVFAVSFAAFSGFIIGNGLGLFYALWFWIAWLLYAAVNPRLFITPFSIVVPWLFPIWALLSMFWSRDPIVSGRNAIELMLTTAIAIIATRALTPRGILLSLFFALFAGSVVGLSVGRTEVIYTGNVEAMNGIFGSKNSFAMFASLLLLTGLGSLYDRGSPPVIRLLAFLALPIAAYELFVIHSVGAIVTAVVAALLLTMLAFLRYLSVQTRVLSVLGALLLLAAVSLGAAYLLDTSSIDALLASIGKNPTLTGRTYLWARADETIAQYPWLGIGFQAYWQQSFIDAEGLWRYLMIASRSGVTMHNLYYETRIEVGLIGFVILIGTIFATLIAALFAAVLRPDPMAPVSVAASLFFLSRTFLETEFLAPFAMGTMLLPLMWSISLGSLKEWRRSYLRGESRTAS